MIQPAWTQQICCVLCEPGLRTRSAAPGQRGSLVTYLRVEAAYGQMDRHCSPACSYCCHVPWLPLQLLLLTPRRIQLCPCGWQDGGAVRRRWGRWNHEEYGCLPMCAFSLGRLRQGCLQSLPSQPPQVFSFSEHFAVTHLTQSGALPQTTPQWNPAAASPLPASPRLTAPHGFSGTVSGQGWSNPGSKSRPHNMSVK